MFDAEGRGVQTCLLVHENRTLSIFCSRLTALWRYTNFVLLLLVIMHGIGTVQGGNTVLCDGKSRKREYYLNCFILATCYLFSGHSKQKQFTLPGWAMSLSLCFLGCIICFYVHVSFVLPWSVESFPFMFWRWRNKLKWSPFEFFAPSPLLRVGSWLHPF